MLVACPECGNPCAQDAPACPKCGQPDPAQASDLRASSPPRKKGRLGGLALGAFLSVFGVLIALVYALTRDPEDRAAGRQFLWDSVLGMLLAPVAYLIGWAVTTFAVKLSG